MCFEAILLWNKFSNRDENLDKPFGIFHKANTLKELNAIAHRRHIFAEHLLPLDIGLGTVACDVVYKTASKLPNCNKLAEDVILYVLKLYTISYILSDKHKCYKV